MGGRMHSYNKTDIADMQCWLFRMAQKRWKQTPKACADIFRDNDILGYISDCYGMLHLSGYERALDDVEELLTKRGVRYDAVD